MIAALLRWKFGVWFYKTKEKEAIWLAEAYDCNTTSCLDDIVLRRRPVMHAD